MRKSASRLEEPSSLGELLREGLVLTGGAILARPALVGGTTAFLVATAFVSANALWYQPYQHTGAFFTTRALIQREPVAEPSPQPRPAAARVDTRPADPQPATQPAPETTSSLPAGDPQVARVQQILKKLELYAGDVDGLTGPQTSGAVEHYQRLVGMTPNGRVDEALLRQLGIGEQTQTAGAAPAADAGKSLVEKVAVAIPASVPVPRPRPADEAKAVQPAEKASDPTIVRIQAGLKAFGNDGIELDGVVGARTRSAIKEFQSLFGLKVTGEPDAAVYAKMREIGLTE
jgi:peptidoglycan hydrolase-like protein with peptidoglycan-binding domain